jgi:diguanylate cyclase (GGDEF)-like protein
MPSLGTCQSVPVHVFSWSVPVRASRLFSSLASGSTSSYSALAAAVPFTLPFLQPLNHMRTQDNIRLERQDLLRFAPLLQESIGRFLPMSSHTLLFPNRLKERSRIAEAVREGRAIYSTRDKKVLVPLVLDGELLGVFVAGGVKPRSPKTMAPVLFQAGTLVLEKLLASKRSQCDPLTGLGNRGTLNDLVTAEVELILSCILPGPEASVECSMPSYSASFGLILVDLDHFKWINHTFGHLFGDRILTELARLLESVCREGITLCRAGGDTFALFWPQATPRRCARMSETIRERIAQAVFTVGVSEEEVSLTGSVGYVNFPHDLQGWQLKTPAGEQARIVLEKARKAVDTAKESGRNRVCSFTDILERGGRVMEVLPMDRVIVNLGRGVDAQEGLRFLVWSGRFDGSGEACQGRGERVLVHYPALHKAEIQLLEIQESMAVAQILTLEDRSWRIEPGDRLTLASDGESLLERRSAASEPAAGGRKDLLSGLFPLRDFLQLWSRRRQECSCFSMVLLRMQPRDRERPEARSLNFEKSVQDVAGLFAREHPQAVGGRYSTNRLIFFLLETRGGDLLAAAAGLCREAHERCGVDLALGIAEYPFLHFARADILENCRKGLDHALLLSPPCAALFNSVSLTVSGDFSFTQGDIYSAMEEYKLALLADEDNHLARNSLGICYARLGRLSEARAQFDEILRRDPQHFMALYNSGCTSLRLGEDAESRRSFLRCLELTPGHPYTLLRLGMIMEREGDLPKAEECYRQASRTPEGARLAHRHLAQVALKEGREEDARDELHRAILVNPRDAHSLHLLARIYLDRGDDPQIGESLARQSATLKPDNPVYWAELVRALELQGRADEAREVKVRERA